MVGLRVFSVIFATSSYGVRQLMRPTYVGLLFLSKSHKNRLFFLFTQENYDIITLGKKVRKMKKVFSLLFVLVFIFTLI